MYSKYPTTVGDAYAGGYHFGMYDGRLRRGPYDVTGWHGRTYSRHYNGTVYANK